MQVIPRIPITLDAVWRIHSGKWRRAQQDNAIDFSYAKP
jgi:hypothetical protein